MPQAHSELALDAVDELDDFDRALEHDKQSRSFALIDGVFAGVEINVRSRPRDIRQGYWRKRGKDRNRGKFVWRQHVLLSRARRENAGALCGGVRRSVKPPSPQRPGGLRPFRPRTQPKAPIKLKYDIVPRFELKLIHLKICKILYNPDTIVHGKSVELDVYAYVRTAWRGRCSLLADANRAGERDHPLRGAVDGY